MESKVFVHTRWQWVEYMIPWSVQNHRANIHNMQGHLVTGNRVNNMSLNYNRPTDTWRDPEHAQFCVFWVCFELNDKGNNQTPIITRTYLFYLIFLMCVTTTFLFFYLVFHLHTSLPIITTNDSSLNQLMFVLRFSIPIPLSLLSL